MAKKRRLSEKEQIKRIYRKKRVGITIKIIAVIIGIAIVIPLSYQAYYTIVFSVMPQSDHNPDKRGGEGYSKPLKIAEKNDKFTYTLAYYYNGYWHVVDDSQAIKENINQFIVYRTDVQWREGSDRHLYVFRDDYVLSHQPLSPFTLIDDRCFRKCMKKMNKEEFEAYCKERNFGGMFIF